MALRALRKKDFLGAVASQAACPWWLSEVGGRAHNVNTRERWYRIGQGADLVITKTAFTKGPFGRCECLA